MKKTISISIGGMSFQIEEDAYNALDNYLKAIRQKFAGFPEPEEIISDMEDRIAEQFLTKTGESKIITQSIVEELITIMGRPEEFGEDKIPHTATTTTPTNKRLMRNPDDVILAGICSGIAAYVGIDPVWVRLISALTVFFGGFGVLLYLVLWIILPEAKTDTEKMQMRGEPVNLKNLETIVKERVEELKKKDSSKLRKILVTPFRLLGQILQALGGMVKKLFPLLFKLIGLAVILFSSIGLAVVTFAITGLLFNANSPYIDFPLRELAHGTMYFTAIISGFLVIFVPIIFAILLGASLISLKPAIKKMGGFTLLGLWVIAIIVFTNAGIKLAPQVEALYHSSPYFTVVSKEYTLKDFTAIELSGADTLTLTEGTEFKILAQGTEKALDNAELKVENGTLVLNHTRDNKLCIFCNQKYIQYEIVAPKINSVSASGASTLTAINLSNETLTTKASGASKLFLTTNSKLLTSKLSGASKLELTGTTTQAELELSGASKALAEKALIKNVTIQLTGASKANFGDLETLEVQASGASKVLYKSAKDIKQSLSGSSKISKTLDITSVIAPPTPFSNLTEPITSSLERITKKPFGIKISPTSSPITPEKFSGFHTGTDFEILENEENSEVPVYAICDGDILLKKSATGYGGVVVQECNIDNEPVTVIYGHLRLQSINAEIGDKLNAGERLGVLGKSYSTETGNERKHLHLGIHKGTAVNILGYTTKQTDLANWLDPVVFLR